MLVKVEAVVPVEETNVSDKATLVDIKSLNANRIKQEEKVKPLYSLSMDAVNKIPLTLATKFQSILFSGNTFTDLAVNNEMQITCYTREESNLATSTYEMGEFAEGIITFIKIMNFAANLQPENSAPIYGFVFSIIEPLLYGTFKYVDSIDWLSVMESVPDGEVCEVCAIKTSRVAHSIDNFVSCTEQITNPIHIELGGEFTSPEVYPIVFVNNTFTFYTNIEYGHNKLYAAEALFSPITTGYISFAPSSLDVKIYPVDDSLVIARNSATEEQYAYDVYGRNPEVYVAKVHDPMDKYLKPYLSVVYAGKDHKLEL